MIEEVKEVEVIEKIEVPVSMEVKEVVVTVTRGE